MSTTQLQTDVPYSALERVRGGWEAFNIGDGGPRYWGGVHEFGKTWDDPGMVRLLEVNGSHWGYVRIQ